MTPFIRMMPGFFAILLLIPHQSTSRAQEESLSKETEIPISVTLLSSRVRTIQGDTLSQAIEAAWGKSLSEVKGEKVEPKKIPDEFFVARKNGFIIQTQQTRFVLSVYSEPWRLVPTEDITDVRTRNAVKAHKAHIAIDHFPDTPKALSPPERKAITKQMCQLMAEFADTSTTGIVIPSEEILLTTDKTLPESLRADDPVEQLKANANVAILDASDDDPELKAATATARRTWPDFVKAFQKQAPGTESFGAKFPFATNTDKKEHMWIHVTEIDADSVTGQIANDPELVKDLKYGDTVTRKVSDLSDWMYYNKEEIVGGYTVKVLMKRQESGKKP